MAEKIRILVVEADEFLCNTVAELLELDGYRALACSDARIARLVLATFLPQVVIISYSLSNSYDYESLIAHCQHLYPILYLCNPSTAPSLRANPLYNNQDMCLEKPFDVAALMHCIVLRSYDGLH